MNLLSKNILIIVTTLLVISETYFFITSKLSRRSVFLSILLTIIGVSLIDVLIIHTLYRGELFPDDLWLGAFPLVMCLILSIYNYRKHRKFRKVTTICAILSIVFIAVLTNQSYGYYPTLASLVSHRSSNSDQDQVTILRLHKVTGNKVRDQSIERSYTAPKDTPSQGKVFDIQIPGEKSKFKSRTASIYIPPAGFVSTDIKLPVLILMAGSPGAPQDWLHGGNLEKTTNDFAALHKGLAPLVVLVDQNGSQTGDTECVDSPRGNVETFLTVDVPSYIKNHYNVIQDPESWAIGGLSNGGTCGVMLALRHPDIFKNFLDFSGESKLEVGSRANTIKTLFAGSEQNYIKHDPMTILSSNKFTGTHGWIEYGRDDAKAIQSGAMNLYDSSKTSGLDISIEAIKGTHSFYVWSQSFHDSLPWLSQNLGLIPQQ